VIAGTRFTVRTFGPEEAALGAEAAQHWNAMKREGFLTRMSDVTINQFWRDDDAVVAALQAALREVDATADVRAIRLLLSGRELALPTPPAVLLTTVGQRSVAVPLSANAAVPAAPWIGVADAPDPTMLKLLSGLDEAASTVAKLDLGSVEALDDEMHGIAEFGLGLGVVLLALAGLGQLMVKLRRGSRSR
jgi:hypothetical protein